MTSRKPCDAIALVNPIQSPEVETVTLPGKGGLITLVNDDGLRADGVSDTKAMASNPGFLVKF